MDIRPTYNVLDCFSGYGGFALGLRLAYPDADFRTVAYIEWDKYCQQVIQSRIEDGHLDDAPIWDDIKSFDGRPWRGAVDILSAGFPCQPHSNAGLRKGADDCLLYTSDAADAGAPHLRNRWWLVAYPNADLRGRLHREHGIESATVSYTHLTLPTNREV